MYLLGIYFKNARENGDGSFHIEELEGKIRKWTTLDSEGSAREFLQCIGLACGGASFVPRLPCNLDLFRGQGSDPLTIEFTLIRHPEWDGGIHLPPVFGSGLKIDRTGKVTTLKRDSCPMLPPDIPVRNPCLGHGNVKYFLLAYGPSQCFREGKEDFDFEDPFHRIKRFHSLFNRDAPVTDPMAFLTRLHYKAVLKSRYPAQQSMRRLCDLLKEFLQVDTDPWMQKECDFRVQWAQLKSDQQMACLPVLDAVRHMYDAFSSSGKPLNQPGVMLLDRPDIFCTHRIFPLWVTLMNRLLPSMQYLLTASKTSIEQIPREVREDCLPLPLSSEQRKKKDSKARVSRDSVLLIQVDGRLPNLALMKLSRYYKEQGRKVILDRGFSKIKGADIVYGSCVYSSRASMERVKAIKDYYGKALLMGGSGVHIHKRLPKEIEKLPPDYTFTRN